MLRLRGGGARLLRRGRGRVAVGQRLAGYDGFDDVSIRVDAANGSAMPNNDAVRFEPAPAILVPALLDVGDRAAEQVVELVAKIGQVQVARLLNR